MTGRTIHGAGPVPPTRLPCPVSRLPELLVAVLLLVTLLPIHPLAAAESDLFNRALAAYEAGNHAEARTLWAQLPTDPRALFNLGQMARRGQGGAKDVPAAMAYYEKAARLGHVAAQANLGTLYFFDPKAPDPKRAIHWWRLAALNGDPYAQHMMGVLYVNGEHLEQDLIKGYAWNHLAAEGGYAPARETRTTLERYLTQEQLAAARKLAPNLRNQARQLTAKPAGQQPPPSPIATARVPPAGSGYWLQLGAFSQAAGATALWQQLQSRRAPGLQGLPHRLVPLQRAGKTLYRLQAGPVADKSAAGERCRQLRAAGQACLAVQ